MASNSTFRFEPSKRVPAYFPLDGIPIAIVGQAPGKNEVEQGRPFVGGSGELIQDCFKKVGLPWQRCMHTNVIGFRPPGNDFGFFCAKREAVGKDYKLAPIATGQYLQPRWLSELDRLKEELETYKPNLVIAAGNEALWALCEVIGITKYQNSIIESTLIPGLKVLPIFHPAAALRQFQLKAYITQALTKARVEYKFPEIRRPAREIWIYPSVDDLWLWYDQEKSHGPLLSADIETTHGHIDCIGFSFRKECALVVPFWSDLRDGHSYWRTMDEEIAAWDFVEKLLSEHEILGQNFICFDLWRLLEDIGIFVRHAREDTMTAHHAYQPELAKDLGFLTATYCNDAAYKMIRPRGKKSTKKDD